MTVIFIVGIFLSKTKDVDYSTAMAQEINDLENQLDQLESNYDLEFDLDHQHRIREQWQNAIKTKEMLDEKHNYLNQTMNEAQHRLHSLTESIDKVKKNYIYRLRFLMNLLSIALQQWGISNHMINTYKR